MGLSENSVPLHPLVLLIIIPIKWLFHWEYTQHFQTNPDYQRWTKDEELQSCRRRPPKCHHRWSWDRNLDGSAEAGSISDGCSYETQTPNGEKAEIENDINDDNDMSIQQVSCCKLAECFRKTGTARYRDISAVSVHFKPSEANFWVANVAMANPGDHIFFRINVNPGLINP